MGTDNTAELDSDLSVLIRVIRGRLIWNQLIEECSQLACMFRDGERISTDKDRVWTP